MSRVDRSDRPKPLLRGVSHQAACYATLGAGAVLTAFAPTGRTALAAAIYGICLAAMYGISALYHRVTWRPAARARMRRLDHATIFLLIAGTYTAIAMLVLDAPTAARMLAIVWLAATAGIAQAVFWVHAPKPLTALFYLGMGCVGVPYLPQITAGIGVTGVGLLLGGGMTYAVGALVYALQRPDPAPTVFGYHEIFHALVILASILHFVAIAGLLHRNGV